jgi:serine phosphatase RsbU (regulator of sigma subunit)
MKIRTQLVVAFLLLAVVPLAGIVLYSYYSSLRAVRRAAETEARMLTREMDGRMASIKGELGRGVERIGALPVQTLIVASRSHHAGKPDPLLGQVVQGFGDAAPFLRSIEFIPAPPAVAPRAPTAPVAPMASGKVVVDVDQILRDVQEQVEAVAPPAPITIPLPGGTEALQERVRQEMEEGHKLAERLAKVEEKRVEIERKRAEDRLLLGRDFEVPVRRDGQIVGRVKAQISGDEVVWRVLARPRGEGEVPFAVDAKGNLHTVNKADRATIEKLPIAVAVHDQARSARWVLDDWVVATSKDPQSGLIFGIARPVPLQAVRQAAARNFGYGLGMIGLALLGILPLSTRMTRNLKLVTQGADRIRQGDLQARIPVRSRDEFGALALTFNHMAEDLERHQALEIEQALLRTEYERKTQELEEARRFQLSLLPKTLPASPAFEIAVSMRTATEVGGDYYDFHLQAGALTAAVGDATGHGARAGTMVTVVKSLFAADAGASRPREFLGEAARAVKSMELGRMAMALCLARLEGRSLTLSSAGMPPVLVYRRATGQAEEIALQGMPLGGLASDYQERCLGVDPGDAILMMTDGLPELTNGDGDPLGYPRVRSLFESLGGQPPEEVLAGLTSAAESWSGGQAPKDDITFVVIRIR